MVYHLHFEIENDFVDLFVRIKHPVSFQTFLKSYLMNKTKIKFQNLERSDLKIKDLKGVYELDVDHPATYELSQKGQLIRTYEEID